MQFIGNFGHVKFKCSLCQILLKSCTMVSLHQWLMLTFLRFHCLKNCNYWSSNSVFSKSLIIGSFEAQRNAKSLSIYSKIVMRLLMEEIKIDSMNTYHFAEFYLTRSFLRKNLHSTSMSLWRLCLCSKSQSKYPTLAEQFQLTQNLFTEFESF